MNQFFAILPRSEGRGNEDQEFVARHGAMKQDRLPQKNADLGHYCRPEKNTGTAINSFGAKAENLVKGEASCQHLQ